jgi:hypothetical protein
MHTWKLCTDLNLHRVLLKRRILGLHCSFSVIHGRAIFLHKCTTTLVIACPGKAVFLNACSTILVIACPATRAEPITLRSFLKPHVFENEESRGGGTLIIAATYQVPTDPFADVAQVEVKFLFKEQFRHRLLLFLTRGCWRFSAQILFASWKTCLRLYVHHLRMCCLLCV